MCSVGTACLCHCVVVGDNLVPQSAVAQATCPGLIRPSLSPGLPACSPRWGLSQAVRLLPITPELPHLSPQILILAQLFRVHPSASMGLLGTCDMYKL